MINNTNNITAEDFIESKHNNVFQFSTSEVIELMRDFAKFHVREALIHASKNATTEENEKGEYGYVNTKSILESYNIDDIR